MAVVLAGPAVVLAVRLLAAGAGDAVAAAGVAAAVVAVAAAAAAADAVDDDAAADAAAVAADSAPAVLALAASWLWSQGQLVAAADLLPLRARLRLAIAPHLLFPHQCSAVWLLS